VVAAKVMEPVSSKLYELESQSDRPRGRRAPRPPYRIAAEQTAALLGAQLSDQALDKAALAFHHGLAVPWAPTYALLRRRASLGPVTAGCRLGPAGTPPLITRTEAEHPARSPGPADVARSPAAERYRSARGGSGGEPKRMRLPSRSTWAPSSSP